MIKRRTAVIIGIIWLNKGAWVNHFSLFGWIKTQRQRQGVRLSLEVLIGGTLRVSTLIYQLPKRATGRYVLFKAYSFICLFIATLVICHSNIYPLSYSSPDWCGWCACWEKFNRFLFHVYHMLFILCSPCPPGSFFSIIVNCWRAPLPLLFPRSLVFNYHRFALPSNIYIYNW